MKCPYCDSPRTALLAKSIYVEFITEEYDCFDCCCLFEVRLKVMDVVITEMPSFHEETIHQEVVEGLERMK